MSDKGDVDEPAVSEMSPSEDDSLMLCQEDEEMEPEEGDDSSSELDSEDDDEAEKEKIRCLEEQILSYPYTYAPHLDLIRALRQAGELERLRAARQYMSEIFPLTEELWLEWLKDEVSLATEDDRERIEKLFDKAVSDYLAVDVWLEYVQYAIGGMGSPNGISHVRAIFDRAVTEVGLHVVKGANIWDAYREFENAILAGLEPEEADSGKPNPAYIEQKSRLVSLFKRQLTVPLLGIKDTYAELKEWFPELASDKTFQQIYQQTLSKLEKLKPFEKELAATDEYYAKMEAYYKYIEYELSLDDPARIQCIYERAITHGYLNAELWLQYTRYLDTKLPIKKVVLSAYERSVRNCPWKAELWGRYILAMERHKEPDVKITDLYEQAINSGFTEPTDFLHVYTVFCDYKRRRIDWTKEYKEELADFRATIQKAIHSLKTFFGDFRGDPSSLQQYWASIEVRHCKNIEKARELWNSIMTQGHGAESHMWMEYFQMEKAYGNAKNCRKVLQRALNSVTDWPQGIVDAYLQFEREEGTLEDYEISLNKCTAQLQRLQQRQALAKEKEQMMKEQKRLNDRNIKKVVRKPIGSHERPGDSSTTTKRKLHEQQQVNITDKDGFKIPVVPALVGEVSPRQHDPEGPTSAKKVKTVTDKPPPGFTPKFESSKQDRTVFVSNISYDLDEDNLEEIFSKCGEIVQIRLVQNYKGKSKGYAYVEFKSTNSLEKALKMDREMIEGRPIFVSKCEDRSVTKTHQFKFSTNLEKNKLFIKGLPFSCTKDDLEKIFKEHGTVKDVRLVTYRNGAPKGLAYVEYEDPSDATKAILKTDGLTIGEHTISVSISNPPSRKSPMNRRSSSSTSTFTPTLGGGKKESEVRGKARTMVSLVPRALQRTKATSSSSSNGNSSVNDQSSNNCSAKEATSSLSSSSSGMSNDDFRKMLLKR
ncbi:squamous cell carcinoma antigen recognized by T-cells 3-like isoform X1 [Octopus vulgaris]|uniref:Squamous cell carcinoma antigen recognized by T-cells 3-like isoform X1 n=1 Tax=Octopus vulgaris TaxID=6645 RepID=A0AA36AJC8_OCTVU|nr:squamous cell carcinoma antigen recognized by T-cells 3-like isoform X1 [Octopus vulgaris]